MWWYCIKLNLIGSLGHHQHMFFQSYSHDIQHCAYFGIQNDKLNLFLKRFLKCNWVTGSPPKFDTLLASWYPTYIQSFIISLSPCAEQYGDMSSDTQTHSHTIKPPTAGVRQVGHTSINYLLCICCVSLSLQMLSKSPIIAQMMTICNIEECSLFA